jgi:hypothetical protein
MPLGNIIGPGLVNGVEYSHVDIRLNILGVTIIGVTQINYADPQEITLNHSTGALPTSRGYGAVNPEGTITITSKAAHAIQLAAQAVGKQIQNIPAFDIGVNYTTVNGDLMRHSLRSVVFKGRNTTSSVGNSQIEETWELSIGKIDWNAI